jgi:anaerobic selenocysteine-containing dehydrogenase
VIVAPKDPDATDRLDVGNPLMMADLYEKAGSNGSSSTDQFDLRLLCRRMHRVMNSSYHISALDRGRPYNPAFMHPDDLEQRGLNDGDLAEISSARASILAIVTGDPNLRPGVVSMTHGFGDVPELDHEVRQIGSPVNRLLSVDETFERYSGQPLMSNVPVSVRQAPDS